MRFPLLGRERKVGLEFLETATRRIFQQERSKPFCWRKTFDEFGVAAPLRGHKTEIAERELSALGGRLAYDFVDGHDDRKRGGFGVFDGFLVMRQERHSPRRDQHQDSVTLRRGRHASEGFVGRVYPRKRLRGMTEIEAPDVLGPMPTASPRPTSGANGVKASWFRDKVAQTVKRADAP